jgi:hypothetical protein
MEIFLRAAADNLLRPTLAARFAPFSNAICVSLERLPARSGNRAPGIPDLTLDPPVFPFAGFRADRAQAGAPDVRASVVPASRMALSLAVEYFW